MGARTWLSCVAICWTAATAWADPPAPTPAGNSSTDQRWRSPGSVRTESPPGDGMRPVATASRRALAEVRQGIDKLPNEHGQVWREYDISPYTLRVTTTKRPEQAVVDWVLRETGYEAWHGEPLGILSANGRSLKVYHTPEMHTVVGELVDRFVNSEAASQAFGLRVVTLGNPNWRARALGILRPISVQTQGIQAWLVPKEDAALLLAEFRKRMDFKEHSSPHLVVHNGQSTTVAVSRPRNYVRDILLRGQQWPGFEPELAQIDEGFAIELSPLLSVDRTTVDAVIKCNIDQVEKLIPVMLDIPSALAGSQRTKLEVPQVAQTRLHERFRWPVDHVLIVGLGVVAMPNLGDGNPLKLPLPLPTGPDRADLLLFIDSKGEVAGPAPATTATRPDVPNSTNYHGRY